jgi:hypothetical protein
MSADLIVDLEEATLSAPSWRMMELSHARDHGASCDASDGRKSPRNSDTVVVALSVDENRREHAGTGTRVGERFFKVNCQRVIDRRQ